MLMGSPFSFERVRAGRASPKPISAIALSTSLSSLDFEGPSSAAAAAPDRDARELGFEPAADAGAFAFEAGLTAALDAGSEAAALDGGLEPASDAGFVAALGTGSSGGGESDLALKIDA